MQGGELISVIFHLLPQNVISMKAAEHLPSFFPPFSLPASLFFAIVAVMTGVLIHHHDGGSASWALQTSVVAPSHSFAKGHTHLVVFLSYTLVVVVVHLTASLESQRQRPQECRNSLR